VALVAVACNLFRPTPSPIAHPRCVCGGWAVDGASLVFYFLSMIVFCLKVLLAIGAGLVMTALL
jgi:hypothetical protein